MAGGGGGSDGPQETNYQRELGTIAGEQYEHYKQKFQPLQDYAIKQVTQNNAGMQRQAQGINTANYEQQFAKNAPQVTQQATLGTGLGSGRATLGVGGYNTNLGQSLGASSVGTGLTSQRQFATNLQSLINIGSGQSGSAITGLSDAADTSAKNAELDARAAAAARGAIGSAAGTFAGYGLGSVMNNSRVK